MLQLLYDLLNWQYFGILAIVWVVADLIWIGRWRELLHRLGTLLTKPTIFEKDDKPNEPPLYPRRFLEQLAQRNKKENQVEPSAKSTASKGQSSSESTEQTDPFVKFVEAQKKKVFDPENPLRSLGYVLAFAAFVFFLLADAITVANTLELLGLIAIASGSFLERLDLAILGGAIMAAVVGVWMLIEMSGRGEMVNTDTLTDSQKKFIRGVSAIVTLLALGVMVAYAVQRLIALGSLQSSPTVDLILAIALYAIQPINISLAAAITFSPAASGIMVLLFLISILLNSIMPLLAFLIDVAWRILYVAIDVVVWALFTPIIAIPYMLGRLFKFIS